MKKRDIGAELLEAVNEIKGGGGKRYFVHAPEEIRQIRAKLSVSQSEMAALLGVSARTLQSWEQGKRKPSGAAASLLTIAYKNPRVIQDTLLSKV